MTTFSPCVAGRVEMRRSTGLPFTATRARPSCGRRRSAMSRPDMILMREMSGSAGLARDRHRVAQHAVDAVAHHHHRLARLDVDVARPAGDAIGQQHVDQLDDRPGTRLGRGGLGVEIVLLVGELGDVGGFHPAEDVLDAALAPGRAVEHVQASREFAAATRGACGLRDRWRTPAPVRRRCRTDCWWRPRAGRR